ncbi:capsule assembly Wzi family protein [Negadavirga shengliensis]|uniref:Capsule assembly Wzi family protein n=1 Tax=Negadavirga shengliensis TaxID=1389218 RepID=A0ABV9T2W1_9BACT
MNPSIFFKIPFWFIVIIFVSFHTFAQNLRTGSGAFEEGLRRKQLLGEIDSDVSLNIRPLAYSYLANGKFIFLETESEQGKKQHKIFKKKLTLFPVQNSVLINTHRPYGWGNGLMIPNVGLQNFTTLGGHAKLLFLNVQLQPEFVIAQNLAYPGFPDTFDEGVTRTRFLYWNSGDFPERFGEGVYSKLWWGQSKLTAEYGAFELGVSTQNIWWGPGQFNTLTIGNNAPGFPHLTLNTIKPAKTFLGNLEMQLILGNLIESQLPPTQFNELNSKFFKEFSGDDKYLNGFSISYNPKWIPNLFLGVSRTYQQYNTMRGGSFRDWFPVIDPLQKTRVGFDRDSEGKDQQVTVFGRYLNQQANAEIYVEYGKRDHSYNWREFILNPDHARAFLMGFNKIFGLSEYARNIQIRGEITHQQESVNRYVRYWGLLGGLTWHTHYIARGFTNYGQPLGVGTGVGSNAQTLEFSLVEKLNKMGILLERVANHQDFYYRAFGQQQERQPWVDLSLGLLFDHQWDNLLVSSKLQFINGLNYQWQLTPDSTPEFPSGDHKFAFMGQVHVIYLWGRKE